MRTRSVISTVVACCLFGAAFAAPAEARWSTAMYTFDEGSGCSDPVDPINVFFYGRSATWRRTSRFIRRYTDWDDGDGSDQEFKSSGRCRIQRVQRADGGNASSRFHIRLSQLAQRDRRRRRATVGDAHHEDLNVVTNCFPAGHAVDKGTARDPTPNGSGFDQGRRELVNAFRARGRRVRARNWGNTLEFEQCDGDLAGSDGLTAFTSIRKRRR